MLHFSVIMQHLVHNVGLCGTVRCEPGWHLDAGWSARLADHDLWFVWAGRGRMTLRGGRTIDLRPGICVWARPGGRYVATQDLDDRLGVTFIHFTPGPALAPDPPQVHDIADLAYFDAVTRRIVTLHESDGDAIARPLLEGVVADLLAGRCTRPQGVARRHEAVARRAATLIREAPGEIVVADLAEQAGYSVDHFTRVFTAVHGVGPRAYAIDRRIERARALLDETTLTIARIAEVLGYDTPAFFCRQFKQRVGVSPGRFRSAR